MNVGGPFFERLNLASSHLCSLLTAPRGSWTCTPVRQPSGPLPWLYEFEACPFCRRVRQALTRFGIDVEIRPCPKGGTRFRPEVKAMGGKSQFPYLVDRGAGVAMYESKDIVRFLRGANREETSALPGEIPLGSLGSIVRLPFAPRFKPAGPPPEHPLELWSSEFCPRSRLVREALCRLELPYILRSRGSGEEALQAFQTRFGSADLPGFYDPNTDMQLTDPKAIRQHLGATYAR